MAKKCPKNKMRAATGHRSAKMINNAENKSALRPKWKHSVWFHVTQQNLLALNLDRASDLRSDSGDPARMPESSGVCPAQIETFYTR